MNGVGSLLPLLGLQPIHQPFDMITMLGFLILTGTVVNGPILVVGRAGTWRRGPPRPGMRWWTRWERACAPSP
ncbi:hypothetical protein SAMN05660831_01362 [Thiohalospira halophila DSM 15071]|uniref:Uncharacterized protein n=1 Tax=Thiohalospira halophila DSM 15071 TaxID=1123397 RepID=A0A1I1R7X8_9GAMM|nr:hypothetical protein [Thiohalospira halophila]SFD30446.1 hypothetical protein SAMN05660831_01362 [Thiohalospira halophila DSM 15071]